MTLEWIALSLSLVAGASLPQAPDIASLFAPDYRPAERAVACAVSMQKAMDEVNRECAEAGLPTLEMGIGVHTGEVIVGNIGSKRRTKYGLVGRNVNLASRVETYTVGGQVLISEATAAEVGERLRAITD